MKGKRARILVVEDDRALAGMYRSALRFAGFDVHVAANAIAALWHIEQSPPEAVLFGLDLPGLRGEDPWRDLRACGPAILRKPFDATRLVSVVEEQLASAA